MDSSSNSTGVSTTLTDLNDDCLLELFKYLGLSDLCAVADVCSRFRQNSTIAFVHSKHKRFNLPTSIHRDGDSREQILMKFSRMLHLFGDSMDVFVADEDNEVFKCNCGKKLQSNYSRKFVELLIHYWREILERFRFTRKSDTSVCNCVEKKRTKYQRKVVQLLIQHCSGTLKKVLFYKKFDLSDEIILDMRPLLDNLQEFACVGASELLLKMLPLWSPELRELQLFSVPELNNKDIWRFDGLNNLTSIFFRAIHDLTNDDVKALLKCNPQLEQIRIHNCKNVDYRSILQVIAKHAPGVKKLTILNCIYYTSDLYDVSTEFAGGFKKLDALRLNFGFGVSNLESVICEIASARAALQHLNIECFDVRDPELFVDGILNFKELKVLKLSDVNGLTATDICSICRYISEVRLKVDVTLNGENLMQLIENAENLSSLTVTYFSMNLPTWSEKIEIHVDDRMINLFETRSKRSQLKIQLDRRLYSINIPSDLARLHRNTLKIEN